MQTDVVLTLFQAEWCPFSSAVRELLTEQGIDYVAKAVEPRPGDRTELKRVAGGYDQIPALLTGDGSVLRGTREIFGYVLALPAGKHAGAHRQRFRDHLEARQTDTTGQLLERATQPVPELAGLVTPGYGG